MGPVRRSLTPRLSGSNVVGIVTNVLTPYMLNPSAWNWRNYAGFFWVRGPSTRRVVSSSPSSVC